MSEPFARIEAEIPLPADVLRLAEVLEKATGNELFVVGGAVREFLFHRFHEPHKPFSPKDFDLATESLPWEVNYALAHAKIRVFPKGEQFGVISAVLRAKEYEIATFREEWYDPDVGDGRRPDRVAYSTPARDAARRDLTINALFYSIKNKEIRDYNVVGPFGNLVGEGIEDIKNKVVKPVGNASERFREDKLRIPRLVRFFSMYNEGRITNHIATPTLEAIIQWRGLAGVSPERIANEFLVGLKRCIHPGSYLKNYADLRLFDSVFPGLKVKLETGPLNWLTIRNPKAILAWVLRDNTPKETREGLNRLKYSNDIFNRVEFLQQLLYFDAEKVIHYLRKRDIWKQEEDLILKAEKGGEMHQDIRDFAETAGIIARMERFLQYEPVAKAKDFLHLQGAEIGKAMAACEADNYRRYLDGHF